MSRLIITGVGNGKVSFVEAEETEVSVDSLRARLAAAETTVSDLELKKNQNNGAISDLKRRSEIEIESRKEILEAEKSRIRQETEAKLSALDGEFELFVSENQRVLGSQIGSIQERINGYESQIMASSRERDKLRALIKGIEAEEEETRKEMARRAEDARVAAAKAAAAAAGQPASTPEQGTAQVTPNAPKPQESKRARLIF